MNLLLAFSRTANDGREFRQETQELITVHKIPDGEVNETTPSRQRYLSRFLVTLTAYTEMAEADFN